MYGKYLLKVKINNLSLFQIVNSVNINIIVRIGYDLHLIYIFIVLAVINCLLN